MRIILKLLAAYVRQLIYVAVAGLVWFSSMVVVATNDAMMDGISSIGASVAEVTTAHKRQRQQADKTREVVNRNSRKASKRSARMIQREAVDSAIGWIPFVGIVSGVAFTAWDIVDICESFDDMNELRASINLAPEPNPVLDKCADAKRTVDNFTLTYLSETD